MIFIPCVSCFYLSDNIQHLLSSQSQKIVFSKNQKMHYTLNAVNIVCLNI